MHTQNEIGLPPGSKGSFIRYPFLFVVISLASIVATFVLTNSTAGLSLKAAGLAGILAAFVALSTLYLRQMPLALGGALPVTETEIERCLRSLDDANEYFAGSLSTNDVFRLVSSRVAELVPFETSELYLLDETRSRFRIASAWGDGSESRAGRVTELSDGTAGRCFANQSLVIDLAKREAAAPLRHGVDVFGVFLIKLTKPAKDHDGVMFESVGERFAPLILNSIAFERSQASALTDVTTDLPNERAFYLILENQIAESQRKPDDRPLSILAMDIKNFADINERFGHAAGDRALNSAAKIIKDNLRQMDFFARSVNDEFLAILPTASMAVSYEVIARVSTAFFGRKLVVTDADTVEIELNFGWAAFGEDGDTAEQLLRAARVRKFQNKNAADNKVLWFPGDTAADSADLASQPS